MRACLWVVGILALLLSTVAVVPPALAACPPGHYCILPIDDSQMVTNTDKLIDGTVNDLEDEVAGGVPWDVVVMAAIGAAVMLGGIGLAILNGGRGRLP